MRQGNGWLRNKLLNPSNGNAPVLSPLINSKGSILTKRSVGLQVQNDHDTRSNMYIPSLENSPPKNPDHRSKVLAVLVALGGLAWRPFPRRTDEIVRLGNDNGHNDEDVH